MLHRHAKPAVAGSFLAGTLTGAALTATALTLLGGLLSPLPASWRATVALGLIALLALRQLGVLCVELPQRAWQIPQTVFRDDPVRAAFRFALELGTGVRTYITTSAPYAIAVVLVLTPATTVGATIAAGALSALGYGAGRALIIALQPFTKQTAVDHPQFWFGVAALISIAGSALIAARAL